MLGQVKPKKKTKKNSAVKQRNASQKRGLSTS